MPEIPYREMVDEVFEALNAHDLNRFAKDHDCSYDWEGHHVPAPVRGREELKQPFAIYLKAFPDLHFEAEQVITSGDYVVIQWNATGTHKGESDQRHRADQQASSLSRLYCDGNQRWSRH